MKRNYKKNEMDYNYISASIHGIITGLELDEIRCQIDCKTGEYNAAVLRAVNTIAYLLAGDRPDYVEYLRRRVIRGMARGIYSPTSCTLVISIIRRLAAGATRDQIHDEHVSAILHRI